MTEFSSQAVRDGLNLTTLIRWGARFGGSFRIDKDSDGNWGVLVMRKGDLMSRKNYQVLVVFDGRHADISRVVDNAVQAIKLTPEWTHYNAVVYARAQRAQKNEGTKKKDYDIWDKRPRDLAGNLIEKK